MVRRDEGSLTAVHEVSARVPRVTYWSVEVRMPGGGGGGWRPPSDLLVGAGTGGRGSLTAAEAH